MGPIPPARLLPGVERAAIAAPPDAAAAGTPALVRGRALIFWDPAALPGTRYAKKLDAIDTDQITPAADCVSESLETLDERWKAGAFRYLMLWSGRRVARPEHDDAFLGEFT